MFRPAKEMHVVRHDNVATNRPTMTFARTLPFFDQHAGSGFMGENVSPISCAYCDKINWWFDPDTSKTAQMFVHKRESRHRCGIEAKSRSRRQRLQPRLRSAIASYTVVSARSWAMRLLTASQRFRSRTASASGKHCDSYGGRAAFRQLCTKSLATARLSIFPGVFSCSASARRSSRIAM